MSSPACEERGADLFLLARDGGEPPPALAPHLAGCAACAADLERLRVLARELPAAHAGVSPRPGTRAAVLRAAEGQAGEDAPPPPASSGGGLMLTFWAPLGALAASALVTVFVLSRSPDRPMAGAPGVLVRPVFGRAAVEGLEGTSEGGLRAGSLLSATSTASLHLGPPVDAEVVLGAGAKLQVPGPSSRVQVVAPALELLTGAVYFEMPAAPAGRSLLVRAGAAEVTARSAAFSLERRAGGVLTVTVGSGSVLLRSGGAERTVEGPCRVEFAPGDEPPAGAPVEPSDATAWFAYPELTLESVPPTGDVPAEIVLTLRPSVPRTLRIAPFHRFDPAFSLRARRNDAELVTVPVAPPMLRRAPPGPDADGAFLLGPDRPYRVVVDPAALGLSPGTWRLEALYTASRVGGLWRGTRASNPVDLVIR